ncbi:major capsid protein [Rhodococcus phage Mbo2]|uniref:Major capsid protein n=1 Tax=Rhodococcus phage Mbo2 TaxID=2936911 RepID=A0A9E7L9W4_9CAUD|nr:major capsid protein [Rhodococcus phage Mbo2]
MSTATFSDGIAVPARSLQTEGSQYAAFMPQNLIVAQEQNLGMVRELVPPQEHVGLSIAPFLSVDSDDVVFDMVRGAQDGLAPQRAQDAESVLWSEDEFYSGKGGASVIDWALKNHYTASDIATYREMMTVIEQTEGQGGVFPLTAGKITEGFEAKVARDTRGRKSRLDNRIEWMITQAITTGKISYTDAKMKWTVDFGRPADQHQEDMASGTYASDTHDPLGDVLAIQEIMQDRYAITLDRAYTSSKVLNTFWKSSKFRLLAGYAPGAISGSDLPYVLPGFGPQAAIDIIERETGIKFIANDNVLRTRANGSQTFVNTRWFPIDEITFLPRESDITAYDDTALGFGKTLTSPHPAANWGTGFYTWEKEYGVDPWGHDIGTGVKAFPVFPHMELTYNAKVILA